MDLIERIFSTEEFMPHGMCYEWDPSIIWLHTLSDGFIALAYYSIPLTLVYLVRKRKDLVFNWMFVCFAVFIIACGTTHILEIVSIWRPIYWLSGIVKAVTAVTSVMTAVLLIKLMPQILLLPSPQQMRKANGALQREIEERKMAMVKIESLNQELLLQTSKLENANAELESFSCSVSHDLRAPLRAILGFVGALEEDFVKVIPQEAQAYLTRIKQGAERLARLIDELLQYSRIAKIEMECQLVDLDQLVKEVILDYPDLQSQSSNIKIEGSLPNVLGHVSGLTQVVANLIGNGIKFVKPGEKPDMLISADIDAKAELARIWFTDKGIGIEQTDQERIFKIFEQVNSRSSYQGTGVGLAVVKKTIQRMQGSVGVQSEVGKGSRFWIELRLARSE